MAVNQITLTVRLHTALRRGDDSGWQNRIELTLPAQSRVQDLLDRLALDFPQDAVLVIIDRRAVAAEQPLTDGADVHLIPAISGGNA